MRQEKQKVQKRGRINKAVYRNTGKEKKILRREKKTGETHLRKETQHFKLKEKRKT